MSEPQQGLAPLAFLLGRWNGAGQDHGTPIRAKLSIEWILEHSFIEARERVFEGDQVVHEDRAIYRYHADEDQVRVTHYVPGGLALERLIVVQDGAIAWWGGPLAPQIRFVPIDDGFDSTVQLPDETEPGVVIRYTRAS